jgi:hypothetical protein
MKQNRSRISVQPDNKVNYGNARLKLTGSLIVIALVCCSAVTIVSLARNGPDPATPSASLSSSPPTAQAAGREPARFVKFNLFDLGIYPRELHVPKGLLSINIEDYSGGSTGLVVTRETDPTPQQVGSVVRGTGGGTGWRGQSEMKLDEGRYIVFMADRPDNRALLVVEP